MFSRPFFFPSRPVSLLFFDLFKSRSPAPFLSRALSCLLAGSFVSFLIIDRLFLRFLFASARSPSSREELSCSPWPPFFPCFFRFSFSFYFFVFSATKADGPPFFLASFLRQLSPTAQPQLAPPSILHSSPTRTKSTHVQVYAGCDSL